MTTDREIKTKDQLEAVISYIIWNYDVNQYKIRDKEPLARIEERENVFVVTIEYINEVRRELDTIIDPSLRNPEKTFTDEATFTLLKTEGFRQLTKYVDDICDEIAKIKIED